jgi:hypothetical protein
VNGGAEIGLLRVAQSLRSHAISKLKKGEKLTNKVLRDGRVIELCAMIRL